MFVIVWFPDVIADNMLIRSWIREVGQQAVVATMDEASSACIGPNTTVKESEAFAG